MRRPKFFLNRKITIGEDEIEPWIEVQPISEYLIPDHKLDEYKQATKLSVVPMRMCIIGTKWIVIPQEYITERK